MLSAALAVALLMFITGPGLVVGSETPVDISDGLTDQSFHPTMQQTDNAALQQKLEAVEKELEQERAQHADTANRLHDANKLVQGYRKWIKQKYQRKDVLGDTEQWGFGGVMTFGTLTQARLRPCRTSSIRCIRCGHAQVRTRKAEGSA